MLRGHAWAAGLTNQHAYLEGSFVDFGVCTRMKPKLPLPRLVMKTRIVTGARGQIEDVDTASAEVARLANTEQRLRSKVVRRSFVIRHEPQLAVAPAVELHSHERHPLVLARPMPNVAKQCRKGFDADGTLTRNEPARAEHAEGLGGGGVTRARPAESAPVALSTASPPTWAPSDLPPS